MAKAGGESGFTLLEVLVAFTILSMSLAASLQVFAGGLRSNRASGDYLTAVSRAQTRLDLASGQGYLRPGDWSGAYSDGMEWQTTIRSTASAGGQSLYTIDVRVSFDDHKRAATLRTARVAP
ncbi:MAG: type II secretion system protein [Pseudomonadota bacterium]